MPRKRTNKKSRLHSLSYINGIEDCRFGPEVVALAFFDRALTDAELAALLRRF